MIPPTQISRRAFLSNGTLILSAGTVLTQNAFAEDSPGGLRVALLTDLHYADKPPKGSRFYKDTPQKLAKAAGHFQEVYPDFMVELGDFIDAADSVDTELGYLKRINKDFAAICDERHYVLGNHCVYTLTKREFLDTVGQSSSYYSFDAGQNHFIVLDSCFRSDGEPYGRKNFVWTDPNIPADEIEWLKADLDATTKRSIVFAHQRLDVNNHYGVKNAAAVRKILEASGKVAAVFQGHSHANDHNEINGIHYCTLVAMVEGSGQDNNAFSVMKIADDATIRIDGFMKQKSYEWLA